jgi:hypothetical protein
MDHVSYSWRYKLYCQHLLTPWSRVILEKLIGSQLVKKFHTFYGTRRFITAFTSVRHLSLSWARSVQSMSPHTTSWRSTLILSTSGSSKWSLSLRFPHQNPVYIPYVLYAPAMSFYSIWSQEMPALHTKCHTLQKNVCDILRNIEEARELNEEISSYRPNQYTNFANTITKFYFISYMFWLLHQHQRQL